MKASLLLVISMLFLAGCNNQIENFVTIDKGDGGGSSTQPTNPPSSPGTSIGSSKAIKISPGAVSAMGSQVQSRLTITPSRYNMTGGQVGAQISIGQSRTN